MTYRYTSPFRPLDIGYTSRLAGVEIDWDAQEIGVPWSKTRTYCFTEPLPERVIESLQLKEVA